MALDENTVDITVTDLTNDSGTIVGYEAKYQDAGREYVISYDADFVKTGETVTKLYDVIELTATDQSFQDAWGSIKDSLSSITDGQTLYFAEVNDSQLVVLGDSNAVLLRVSVWEGSHTWTGWDGTNYRNDDAHYNFHDANWEHLGNAGSNKRYIVRDGEDDILDETGSHLGFSTQDATEITTALGDYAAYSSEYLDTDAEGFSITRVSSQSSSWSGLDHALREEGFETWTDTNERIEIFGGQDGESDDFVGSIELREGFLVVRDANWNTLARLLDGDGLSIDDIEAEYAGFADAWAAVSEFMPSEFQPDVDEGSLKFSVDDWDNILVFDENGAMIGRVHTWEHTHSWTDYMDGSEYTKAHTSTGFNFNDDNWNNIGFFETSESKYTHKDGVELETAIPDETSTYTSYALHKDDASVAIWANIGGNYYLPRLSDDMIEQVETALEMSWSDVDQINIGERDQVWLDNEFRDGEQTGTDTRIEYFEEVQHEGGWSHYELLGSIEIRDGFIEVRDANWNEVVRVIDVTQGKTIDEIDAEYDGFKAAYDQVADFLPSELRDEGVRFTSDEWHIYAFSAAGELLSNINFWGGEHTWTSWDGTEYKNIDVHYNFHDDNWQSIANAGSNDRYIVVDEGDDILDEQGSNYGYTVNSAFLVEKVLEDLHPGVADFLSLDDVSQVRLNTNSWQGLDHDLREDGFEPWSDTEKRVDLFKSVGEHGHMERIGQVAERDGFVEIYNENWESVARLVDGPGLSLAEIEAEFPGFTNAWTAVENYMPSDFRPELEADALKFALGEWDNILVFDANGLLIGRVGVWEHTNTWTNYNDGDRYTVENSSINFNFNDDEWNNIGRYEIQERQYIEKNGEPLAEPIPDETQIFTSYALYAEDATDAEWETFKGEFDLPTLTTEQQTQLGFTWADVDQLSIGKSETTGVANQFRDEAETWSDTRVEYFKEIEHDYGLHYEFMGSMEIRAGFIEVRDSDWNIVIRKIDISSARTLSEIAAMHEGFLEAWAEVEAYLPASLKDSGVRFTSDDWNIYAFSAAGELVSNINFWNGEHTWEGWNGIEYRNVDSHYNFHDSEWNSIANAGSFTRFASDDGGVTEYLDEVGSNSGFTAVGAARDTLIATINDKVFTKLSISEDDVTSIRQNTHSWESKDHDLRDEWFEPFENSNQRIELFKEETFDGHTHDKMIGSLETRGGFIEIYDEYWNKVGQILNGDGLTIDQIEAEVPGFKAAFNAVLSDLPSEFGEDTIKFALGEWDSILIFDDSDEMLSRVDVWTWEDPDTKYRNGEEYTRYYESVTFNFNDANWNDIARYETFSSTYTEKEGEPLETPILESDGYFKSVAIFKDTTTTGAWNTLEDTYGLPDNLSSEALAKLFTWDQVDQISVGTRVENDYAIPEFNRDAKTEEEGRVEYFKKHTDDWGNSWYEYLGMMEKEDGFLEIRDQYWNTVARIADASQLQTWDQIKGDFIQLEESWEAVKASLPDEIKDPSTLKFTVGDRELYAFAEDGTMYEIYFDNEIREYTRSGNDAFEMRYWYDFEESDGPKFADIGGHQDYVIVDDIEVPDDRIQKDSDGNPVNAPFTLNGKLVQLVEQGLHSSSVIREGDIPDEDWAEFNPNNEFIDFSEVVEVEYGTGSWEGLISIARDNAYSDDRVQIEYYGEVENDGWYDRYRLGSLEREGNLETIYDANWNPVGQQLGGDVEGIPLTYLVEVENPYMKAAFDQFEGEMASFFPNLNSIIVTMTDVRDDGRIEAALSDAISGDVLGTLEYDEWENSNNWGWNVHVQGIKGDDDIELFDISGHNEKGDNPGEISDVATDVGFATYRYIDDLTDAELAEFKTKYGIMENVEGFSFDNVLKVKEREEIVDYDEGYENYVYESDVTFIEDTGDGSSNWDYFQLRDQSGFITVENRATDEIVFTTFIPQQDGETVRDLAGPEFDTILGNIVTNHGDVISKSLSKITAYDVTELTFHVLPGDDLVVVDPDGSVVAGGWVYADVTGDGQIWWEITMRNHEDGERILHIGGKNDEDPVTEYLIAGGPNSTRVGEYFYKDDMEDSEWINLLANYGKYFDELPDGTIENAVAIAVRDMVTDAEGDGDYAGGFHEVRFAEADAGRWDGINWDWESNVRIREEGFGYEIFDGGDNRIASGADVTDVTFVNPDADVLAKFNATVADTSVMVDFMTQHSLKAASDDSSAMVIQSNTGSEIMASVTDFGDYYGIRDIETNDWLGWISSYDGDDGNTHIGFGFDLFDLAGDMPDAQKTLITDFLEGTLGPSSEDYSVADIADYRLVVKKVKDGDTVTETYAYAQHLNANGGTLGSTGVDVTNSKFIQMYNRLDTETDQVPDKETPITAQETANIYSSINAILDVIMNQGTVGTLAGLDASTVITPLEPENSGADDDYDVEIFVNADNLLYVDDYTGVVTIEKSTSDEVVLATSAEYDPTFSIYHDDLMGSIDLTSVFKDGLAANVTLADVITNWPSLIDDLTAANSNNSDFALELMSMSDISIGLHDSSGTDTTNTSETTDGSYDHFDPTSFVVEWMIDSMDTFTSFDASTLAVVSEPTIPFEDDHSGGSISASDDTSGGDTSGSPSMYPTFTTYLEDPSATVLIEIHSMSELSDTDLAEVLDLVLFDPSANAYTDII